MVLPQHHVLIDELRMRLGAPNAQIDVLYAWAQPGDASMISVGDADNSRLVPGPAIPTPLMIEVPSSDWHEVIKHTKVRCRGNLAKDFVLYLYVPTV